MKKNEYIIRRTGLRDFNVESDKDIYLVTVDINNCVKCECEFSATRFLKSSLLNITNPVTDLIFSDQHKKAKPSSSSIWKWSQDCLKPSSPQQKFRSLKNVTEDITNIICASGESEFSLRKTQLETFLKNLQQNSNSQSISSQLMLNQSTPVINRRKTDLSNLELNLSFNSDEDNVSDLTKTLVDQSDMFDLSPEILVNKVVNRAGRPKGT
ncbi:unnamed protein product, partial [Brachionus calyciflorus]